jgi:hypothetical protein
MQNILKYTLVASVAFSASACFKKKPKALRPDAYETSCEPNEFWINTNTIQDIGNEAHSGTHASVISHEVEYGLGLSTNIRKVIREKVGKNMRLTCWVKAKQLTDKTGVGLSIFGKDGNHIHWNSAYFAPIVTNNNEWTKFEAFFVIPAIENDQAEFRIFVMNENKGSDLLVDDLKIEFNDSEKAE